MTDKKNSFTQEIRQLGLLTSIPVVLLVGPIAGFLLGQWLDQKLKSHPYLMGAGIILGFVASGREVIRLIREVSGSEAAKK